jgi:hypothetical protein
VTEISDLDGEACLPYQMFLILGGRGAFPKIEVQEIEEMPYGIVVV